MSALRELLAVFDISVNSEELERAAKKVDGFTGLLKTAGSVLAEAFAVGAVGEFVGQTIEAAARVGDLSERLGIGADDLQQWQFAARMAGVESEAAAHSLGFLNKAVGEAVLGGKEQAQDFAKLGVTLKDTNGHTRETSEVLFDVAEAISKLPDQQTRAAYAMKLFGREGQQLLPVFADGAAGLEQLRTEFQELGGGMSNEFVKNAKRVDDSFAALKTGMTSLRSRIVAAMLPALEAFTRSAKGWIRTAVDFLDHTTLLEHGLKLLAIASGVKLAMTLGKLGQLFGLIKPSILGTLGALLEFALPIALVGLLVLAIDDLWTAIQGGDSVIGDMLTGLGGVEGKDAFIKELTDAWDELKISLGDINWAEIIGGAIKLLVGAMYELIEGAKLLMHTLKFAGDFAGNALSWAAGKLTGNKGMADSAKDSLGRDAAKDFGAIKNDADAMWNPGTHWRDHPAVQTMPGPEFDKGPGAVSVGALQYGAPTVAPAGGGGQVNQKNNINVTVQAGRDAESTGRKIGKGVSSELEDQNRNASEALAAL